MTSDFLKITFLETLHQKETQSELEYRNKPFLNSKIFCAPIENFKKLTNGADVKTVYQLDLSLKDIEYNFLPGDTIAVLPENDENEVNELLIRLNIEATCDRNYSVEILKDTLKKNAVIPKHLPPSSSLRNVFLKHIDIRTAPKKLFLKSLIKYTKDPNEKEKLEKICSVTGSQDYAKLLTEHRSLLSLLNAFPSCLPPVAVILEYSTPLNPRYFSVASSPLEKNILSIIFFVVELQGGLKGVCTGWLQRLLQGNKLMNKKVQFYFRKPGDFRLTNIENPNILVATGTGLAPFRSFLQHNHTLSELSANLPETWLFYGCRYSDKDFLCQDELKNYLQCGTLTKLCTAFSRETEKKVYVQHKILDCEEEIVDLIVTKKANIFLCGDVKTVVQDVREAIIQLFMNCKNAERSVAEDIVNTLVKDKRYLVDSWI